MLPFVHFAHLVLGILWLGGTLTLSFAIYPALARLPAPEAARGIAGLERIGGPLLGATGGLTLLLGPLRAWLGGGITTWADFTQPYAHLVITSFVLVVAAQSVGGRFRRRFLALTAEGAQFAATAPGLVARTAAIEAVLLIAVLAIMTALGMGYY